MASPADKPARKKTTAKSKATAPKATEARAARRRQAPTHEAIAKRAYELSVTQDGGDPTSHWLQAERELSAS